MIVCCGEALIDMLPRTSAAGRPVFQPFNGGSIYNTAIALGRLGVKTGFFTGLSTDFFGQSLGAGLKDSGVSGKYLKIVDRPSTLAFVKLDNGHAQYSFFDEGSAGRMLAPKDLPKFSDDVTALHFGSFSLAAEPGATTLEKLFFREAKKRVMCLDPNIRPSLIPNRKAHLTRLNRMIAVCDILKISDEDVRWMTGKDDLAAAAGKWLKLGAKLVVITRGGEGVSVFTSGFTLQHKAQKVTVVDTVGAGDTFTAGLLAALSRKKKLTKQAIPTLDEKTLTAVVEFAGRAAAITVSREGANPPWAHELPA